MKILAIETSCDDTGIAILEIQKSKSVTKFKILANKIHTQIDIHKNYGGVFPMMAKREHGKNIIPTLEQALKEAKIFTKKNSELDKKIQKKIIDILKRENDLSSIFTEFIQKTKKPKIDAIAVTVGPGLEPALWVGISFAKALSIAWNLPIIPVNHMEGHILSVLVKKNKTFTYKNNTLQFPLISLLVSGGHTELVLLKKFGEYKIIGSTRDDAVGEAFDKVARMLGLPYPGGPEISRLAEIERKKVKVGRKGNIITLPRPMLHTKDYDFSFSGLKTAVLYMIRDLPKEKFNINTKSLIAKEFEDAAIEVLVEKTIRAIKEYNANDLIIGGGVSANTHLQKVLKEKIKDYNKNTRLHLPNKNLSTDNALMIAISGYFKFKKLKTYKKLEAIGNMSL